MNEKIEIKSLYECMQWVESGSYGLDAQVGPKLETQSRAFFQKNRIEKGLMNFFLTDVVVQ